MASKANGLSMSELGKLGGRPTKYHDRLLPQVKKLARTGATEQEVADCLNVSYKTFIQWKAQYPRFLHALNTGNKEANKRVARALFHRSVGYSHDSEKIFNDKGTIVRAPYREHIAPDVNAIKFWLTNRDPENWQDKTGVELSGGINLVAQTLSSARQRALAAKSTPPTIEADMGAQLPADTDDNG